MSRDELKHPCEAQSNRYFVFYGTFAPRKDPISGLVFLPFPSLMTLFLLVRFYLFFHSLPFITFERNRISCRDRAAWNKEHFLKVFNRRKILASFQTWDGKCSRTRVNLSHLFQLTLISIPGFLLLTMSKILETLNNINLAILSENLHPGPFILRAKKQKKI